MTAIHIALLLILIVTVAFVAITTLDIVDTWEEEDRP